MAVSNTLVKLVKDYALARRFGLPVIAYLKPIPQVWLKLAGCGQVTCVADDVPCNTETSLICNLISSGISNNAVDSRITRLQIGITGGVTPYTYEWGYSGVFEFPVQNDTDGYIDLSRKHTFDASMGGGIPVSFQVKVTDAVGCTITSVLSYTYTHS